MSSSPPGPGGGDVEERDRGGFRGEPWHSHGMQRIPFSGSERVHLLHAHVVGVRTGESVNAKLDRLS